jgi:hypothetical protein
METVTTALGGHIGDVHVAAMSIFCSSIVVVVIVVVIIIIIIINMIIIVCQGVMVLIAVCDGGFAAVEAQEAPHFPGDDG